MTVPAPEQFASLAIAGDFAALFQLLEDHGAMDSDDLAYKWLSVASDFGHAEADDYLETMMEASSLRYDDDQSVVGGVHFELARAYLASEDGLPRDLARGKAHLIEAHRRHYPSTVQSADTLLADLRGGLDKDALDVVDAVLATPPGEHS